MKEEPSEAGPSPDKQPEQSDTTQKDATASIDVGKLREILENHEPGKASLDDEDLEKLRKEVEKGHTTSDLAKPTEQSPSLRLVKTDQPDDASTASQKHPEGDAENQASLPHVEIRESMLRDAAMRRVKGQSLVEIARYYNRSPRTIRRWLTEAKRRQLIRVDKLDPGQELGKTLFLMESYRAKLMQVSEQMFENDQAEKGLKAIQMLISLEKTVNLIQKRVGLFENYEWWDILDYHLGSPHRLEVDDGEFLEVDDDDPRESGQKRTKQTS